MFVRARDTAANVMYYMMGDPVHSNIGSPSGLPGYFQPINRILTVMSID